MIIDALNTDIKKAMLAGDKTLASILRNLKSAILYEQVSRNTRDESPDDALIIDVFTKELKKRQDAIDLYQQAGDTDRASAELAEADIIKGYLPQQASPEDIQAVVTGVLGSGDIDVTSPKVMGLVIAEAKKQLVGTLVDGATLARIVKENLGK